MARGKAKNYQYLPLSEKAEQDYLRRLDPEIWGDDSDEAVSDREENKVSSPLGVEEAVQANKVSNCSKNGVANKISKSQYKPGDKIIWAQRYGELIKQVDVGKPGVWWEAIIRPANYKTFINEAEIKPEPCCENYQYILPGFETPEPEPPDPDDYPSPDKYQKALNQFFATHPELAELCSNNSTCVAGSAQDFHWQERCSDSNSSDSAKSTSIAEVFSKNDSQELPDSGTLKNTTGNFTSVDLKTNPISSPLVPPASHSQLEENGREPTTNGTAFPQSSERSPLCTRTTLQSKTCEGCSVVPIDQETKETTLDFCSKSYPSSGTMRNGSVSAAEGLPRPSLESDYCWLPSPTALSSTGSGRPPGITVCESELRKMEAIAPGECLKPEALESFFSLPTGWTDPSELRPATELIGSDAPPSGTHSTQGLPELPSNESSTSIDLELSPEEQLLALITIANAKVKCQIAGLKYGIQDRSESIKLEAPITQATVTAVISQIEDWYEEIMKAANQCLPISSNSAVLLNKYLGEIPEQHELNQKQSQFFDAYLHQTFGIDKKPALPETPAITLFVNAQADTYAGESNNICGDIQLSPIVVRKQRDGNWNTSEKVPSGINSLDIANCRLLFDSGAFPEVRIDRRITPEQALNRQLEQLTQFPVRPQEVWLVSYDRLIDEKYVDGDRKKERWSVEEAEGAVRETVAAAQYLDSQRDRLKEFVLVQSCQGVDAAQYVDCVRKVLDYCQPQDVLGLGGWCILGKQKSWLPTFWETIKQIVPLIAEAGIKKIHLFGVTWWKKMSGYDHTPLGSLLWLCDLYDISLSCDGRAPIGNALWKTESGNSKNKAGALHDYWRVNLALTRTYLATLRDSDEYQPPPNFYQLGDFVKCDNSDWQQNVGMFLKTEGLFTKVAFGLQEFKFRSSQVFPAPERKVQTDWGEFEYSYNANLWFSRQIKTRLVYGDFEYLVLKEEEGKSLAIPYGKLPKNHDGSSPLEGEKSYKPFWIEQTVPSAKTPISFGQVLPQLLSGTKTVTRRAWKDRHAKQFVNCWSQGKRIPAFDKDRRAGGKQIGWLNLTREPYKEKLSDMPESDLVVEGFPELTKEEFIRRFFKGDDSQEVWVLRFEFSPFPELALNDGLKSLGVEKRSPEPEEETSEDDEPKSSRKKGGRSKSKQSPPKKKKRGRPKGSKNKKRSASGSFYCQNPKTNYHTYHYHYFANGKKRKSSVGVPPERLSTAMAMKENNCSCEQILNYIKGA